MTSCVVSRLCVGEWCSETFENHGYTITKCYETFSSNRTLSPREEEENCRDRGTRERERGRERYLEGEWEREGGRGIMYVCIYTVVCGRGKERERRHFFSHCWIKRYGLSSKIVNDWLQTEWMKRRTLNLGLAEPLCFFPSIFLLLYQNLGQIYLGCQNCVE